MPITAAHRSSSNASTVSDSSMDLYSEPILPKFPSLLGPRRTCLNLPDGCVSSDDESLPSIADVPISFPVEGEIEEDEITSESEEYDGDYGSSESEDEVEIDSIKNVFTPAHNKDEKKRERAFKSLNERDMKKNVDGDYFFFTNRTPWSFDLVIPFGEEPTVRRFSYPVSKIDLLYIGTVIGNDWAWKALDNKGFCQFTTFFRFRGKNYREKCLLKMAKRRMLESKQEFLLKLPSIVGVIDESAVNVEEIPKAKTCKRRLFDDEEAMDSPLKKKSRSD